jgi:hypothetical protein
VILFICVTLEWTAVLVYLKETLVFCKNNFSHVSSQAVFVVVSFASLPMMGGIFSHLEP